MKRAKNLADLDDLIKIIRGNNVSVDLHKAIGGVDFVASNYKAFFSDCMAITPRLSKLQLARSLSLVHPTVLRSEVEQFAGSLAIAFAHVIQKSKKLTSGQRTSTAVHDLSKQYQGLKPKTLGESLFISAQKKAQAQKAFNSSSASSSSATLLPTIAKEHPMEWSDSEDDWPAILKPGKDPEPIEEILSSQEQHSNGLSSRLDAPHIDILDLQACKLIRRFPDKCIEADMKPGPSGFALAYFGKECIQTEMPNLLLDVAARKKPACSFKKPAAAIDEVCSSHSEDESVVKVAPTIPKESPVASFTKENYKFDSLTWGTCKAEFYSEKSYVRFLDPSNKKWICIVTTTGSNHHEKLEALIPLIKKENMTKDQIIMHRNRV